MNKWIEWSSRSLRLLVVRKWLTLNWFDLILMVLVSTQSSNSRAVLDSLTAARFAGPKANVTNHGDYEEHWLLLLWLPPKRISTTNFQSKGSSGHGVYWSIKNPFMTSSWQLSAWNNQPILSRRPINKIHNKPNDVLSGKITQNVSFYTTWRAKRAMFISNFALKINT